MPSEMLIHTGRLQVAGSGGVRRNRSLGYHQYLEADFYVFGTRRIIDYGLQGVNTNAKIDSTFD